MTEWEADALFYIVPILTAVSGLVKFEARLWFETVAILTAVIVPGTFIGGAFFHALGQLIGTRIQAHKTKPHQQPKFLREALETAFCMFHAAALTAWPVTQWRAGEMTAFRDTLEEASIGTGWQLHTFYALKVLACLLFADAYTYFKHYFLHHPALYAIHRSHHRHANPSSYASFAVHPVEAVLTFLPVVAMCDKSGWITLYLPYHLPFMVGLWVLNLYLHAGVEIPAFEAVLNPLWINSSAYHNTHHESQIAHFSEVLIIWDYILGHTWFNWTEEKRNRVSEAIAKGDGEKLELHED